MTKALEDVAAERKRQVEVEGWTPEHDDKHIDCQLATAAACYAVCGTEKHLNDFKIMGVHVWPWSRGWWKPTTYRRNLVKAAALIIAEIERLDRKSAERLDFGKGGGYW